MQELPEGFCKEGTNNHSFGYVFWNATFNRGEKFLILKIEDEYTIKVKKSFFLEGSLSRVDNWNTVRQGKIRLYKASEMEYSEEIRRERGLSYDRLLYEDDGMDLVGIKPTRVLNQRNMYRIMYADKLLPLASETDSNNIVAGYKMFLNKKALIYAETKDPATGRTIRSNSLTINVSLPDFLKNENGFTFGNNEDLGSGLGGANFIALENLTESIDDSEEIILYNPFKNGINIIIDNTEE